MLALRKQSKKGVLMQTIKCMINLKRKVKARRAAADSSPDRNSDNSSDSCDYTNDDETEENIRLMDESKTKNKQEAEEIANYGISYLLKKVEEKIQMETNEKNVQLSKDNVEISDDKGYEILCNDDSGLQNSSYSDGDLSNHGQTALDDKKLDVEPDSN
ncbi:hypothetical protein HHI36_016559 [Cryptolaemus montrouzieri]